MFYNTTALHVAKGAQDASDPIWTELNTWWVYPMISEYNLSHYCSILVQYTLNNIPTVNLIYQV